jgi:glycosyltransferase involved in cell wall biosynthesis
MTDISVIVPTYNRASLLREAVDSALSQSLPPLEVIVVDDGSTDETEAVLETLTRNPAVQTMRQRNQGVSVARNAGAARARGRYLAFLDSDDVWDRDKLLVQRRAIDDHPECRWCITGSRIVDPEGREVDNGGGWLGFPVFHEERKAPHDHFRSLPDLREHSLEIEGASYTLFVGDLFRLLFAGNVVQPSAAMVETAAFREAGGFDPEWRLAEETEFFHRLSAGPPGCIVMEPLYSWRTGHGGNLVSPANIAPLIENAIASLDRALVLRGAPDDVVRTLHATAVRRQVRKLAYTHLTNLEGGRARDAIRRARARFPGSTRELLPLYLASLLPRWALRAAAALKASLKRS